MSQPYYHGYLLDQARKINAIKAIQEAPGGLEITIRKPKRTSAKNALMWVVLKQMEVIDWYGEKLTDEEWKIVITAKLKQQRAVRGIDGGFVVLGEQTRNMPNDEIDMVIDIACALAGSKGVQIQIRDLSEPHGRVA